MHPDLIAGSSHLRTTLAWHAVAKEVVRKLASTSAAFLVDETPINSAHRVPSYLPPPLTPIESENLCYWMKDRRVKRNGALTRRLW